MKGQLTPLAPDAASRLAFRSAQCALCHHLGAEYGPVYRLLAGPDMVFLALLGELATGRAADLGRRACVVAPLVTRLPVRRESDDVRHAAAVGVWMAVEKLRDDYEDEGGLLRWVAWRSLRAGQARAAARLEAAGVPMAALTSWMLVQRQVEAGADAGLDAAAEPTRSIAAAVFGRAPEGAAPEVVAAVGDIGRHVGGYLFWLDNLVDLPRDVRAGGYNALARAFGVVDPAPAAHEAARAHALAAASAEVDALATHVARLPDTPLRAYVRRVVVAGFRDKLRRYRALPAERLAAADLPDLLPPRAPLQTRLVLGLSAARDRLPARARVLVTFLLAWMAPRSAWAAGWWPEGADPALDAPADTGSVADTGNDDLCTICDPCASNFGWVSCDPGCDQACNDACGSACDGACDGVCDGACGSSS